ncbi:PREDICTED: DNA-binding protein RHL1 [Fragaria vesca subsp. vesca]|uniref:DNA-binding protein RHL1 n=1 Tax=Fragaria vesca subsp. vesca TaxID=101020 RepID=UPI0002C3366F|nr:PREDICTED: DNA-binding protein RHL1 [Fragaria vesca subsp. vesca]
MARGSSKKRKNEEEEDPNSEATERKRLKTLAYTNKLVSEIPARPQASLRPSNAVVKNHGKDIIKKSQRKNRFLFSFPGLFAPIAGGKIGDLKGLGSKSPILYLHFPQGRMKLFGSIVFPKNKYLTLQFPRGGKSVMCEDYFDNMIVFSDAWWIGTEDENPEETQLDFPKELSEGHNTDYDFKGGAGSISVANNQNDHKKEISYAEEHSPDAQLEHTVSDDGNKDLIEVTPVRQSARTAGKRFNFGEASSGDDSVESNADLCEGEDNKLGGLDSSSRKHANGKTENLSVGDLNFVNVDADAVKGAQISEQNQESTVSEAKSKKQSHSAFKEDSHSNPGPLVQATISTLFKKAEKKKVGSSLPSQVQTPQAHKTPRNPRKPASQVSGEKSLQAPSKRKLNQDGGPSKKGKLVKEKDAVGKRLAKKKENEVEDDIEELSSSSQDTDEDWAA